LQEKQQNQHREVRLMPAIIIPSRSEMTFMLFKDQCCTIISMLMSSLRERERALEGQIMFQLVDDDPLSASTASVQSFMVQKLHCIAVVPIGKWIVGLSHGDEK